MTLVERLSEVIERLSPTSRVIVAIDGPDAAGKTTLADAIALQTTRPTLRASIDDWHNPRQIRLGRGADSPLGYYMDSFDYCALTSRLLLPFREGAGIVQSACFDFRLDAPAELEAQVPSPDTALLLDGVFLLRPELRPYWDLSVYLHVSESVSLRRAIARDAGHLGGEQQTRRRYEQRYLPGQALYRAAAAPADEADVVVDNSDPLRPQVLRWHNRAG